MEINSKKLDELYNEWSGEHHTTNSNKQVHDSADCTDFAEYCLKWAVSEGEMTPIVGKMSLSDKEIEDHIWEYFPEGLNGKDKKNNTDAYKRYLQIVELVKDMRNIP